MRVPLRWEDIGEIVESLDEKHQKVHRLKEELEVAVLQYEEALRTVHSSIVQAFNIVKGFTAKDA